MIEGLFQSGRVVDIALVITALEALVLIRRHRLSGLGPSTLDVLLMLGSGVALMLALRAALVDAGAAVIGACLIGSLVVHLIDLARRLAR